MLPLFALTLFASSTLLFLVQPMFAKMVLPLLGGSPGVWNTCILFFQAALLAGYAYAHAAHGWLGTGPRLFLHLGLLLLAFLALPIGVGGWSPAQEANPIPGLLWLLLLTVGLPFFVVSTSAPLLQRWFAATDHPAARDPYFLYAASNLGSMVGLIGYLVVLEPNLALAEQSRVWTAGYGLLVVLTAACALAVMRARRGGVETASDGEATARESPAGTIAASPPEGPDIDSPPGQSVAGGVPRVRGWALKRPAMGEAGEAPGASDAPHESGGRARAALHPLEVRGVQIDTLPANPPADPLPLLRRLRWVALAAAPSSLMLGLTTYVTTDLATVPLLWVLPLVLYLFTFMAAFARRSLLPPVLFLRLLPILALVQAVMLSETQLPLQWQLGLHLLTFFCAAMVCHGELARDRPPAEHLTVFYLLMSAGGCLGGLFNALIAPQIFNSVTEYPLALVAAFLLCPPRARRRETPESAAARARFRRSDLLWPALLGALALLALIAAHHFRIPEGWQGKAVLLGALCLACFVFVERPVRFGLGLGALLAALALDPGELREELHRERSFFGVHRVTVNAWNGAHELYHGTTLHGMLEWQPAPKGEPLTYYTRSGPIGQVFGAHPPRPGGHTAVVGLGIGTLAAYAPAGHRVTYYEIDPEVLRIASNPRFFTFLRDARARGAALDVVLGDARLTLADGPDAAYDQLAIDAFSSDAIPTHLLTREAVRLYVAKLAPRGLLALHISNRHLELSPVVAALAADAGLACRSRRDSKVDATHKSSQRAVLARADRDFGALTRDPEWPPLRPDPRFRLWTDDYSNLLNVLVWR